MRASSPLFAVAAWRMRRQPEALKRQAGRLLLGQLAAALQEQVVGDRAGVGAVGAGERQFAGGCAVAAAVAGDGLAASGDPEGVAPAGEVSRPTL